MKILDRELLRKELGIPKQVPIYYISSEVVEDCHDRMKEEEVHKYIDDIDGALGGLISLRPFDEVVLVWTVKEETGHTSITHYLEDGRYRSFMERDGVYLNMTIRENFSFVSPDIKKDVEWLRVNRHVAVFSLLPFTRKTNRVVLATGPATSIKANGSTKTKKQNFLYITTDKKVVTGSKRTLGGTIINRECYGITKVAGFQRFFHVKPDSKGSDRHGNPTVGWTWVQPHLRGEGQELEAKIRIWNR
tara:strand:+ start:16 stop:756 length:741 start_codon:yes stop_codon:yes gene_type:complete